MTHVGSLTPVAPLVVTEAPPPLLRAWQTALDVSGFPDAERLDLATLAFFLEPRLAALRGATQALLQGAPVLQSDDDERVAAVRVLIAALETPPLPARGDAAPTSQELGTALRTLGFRQAALLVDHLTTIETTRIFLRRRAAEEAQAALSTLTAMPESLVELRRFLAAVMRPPLLADWIDRTGAAPPGAAPPRPPASASTLRPPRHAILSTPVVATAAPAPSQVTMRRHASADAATRRGSSGASRPCGAAASATARTHALTALCAQEALLEALGSYLRARAADTHLPRETRRRMLRAAFQFLMFDHVDEQRRRDGETLLAWLVERTGLVRERDVAVVDAIATLSLDSSRADVSGRWPRRLTELINECNDTANSL